MKKLIQRGAIILIGLSLLLSCFTKGPTGFHRYKIVFKNDSSKEIKLIVYTSSQVHDDAIGKDTLILFPKVKLIHKYSTRFTQDDFEENNYKEVIKISIRSAYNSNSDFREGFELYIEDTLAKEWKGQNPDYLPDSINSPFNYNSWEILKYNEILIQHNDTFNKFIHGELIFTITDKDLE